MRDRKPIGNMLWAVLFVFAATFGFNGCGNVNDVEGPKPPPPAPPGPLTILTSSPLPAATMAVPYDITLAPSGGTPPYTWSLAPGSPPLPDGLVLAASTGKISGTPTTTGTTPTEFKLKDSTGKSVQKVLSITVNIAPTPLAILTNSLTPGTINQFYAFAFSPTGGTSPYTWGLKAGSPLLPNGLTLTPNGVISGTPTVTSNDTHTFTLTDATLLTVEKSLQLSINAIPLSITTNSPLPQGTAGQTYSETLTASGGTGAYTWGLTGGSPALPTGLTLNPSTGEISGIPTGPSSFTHTFTVTDQTPPTPQIATKTLQLIIGAAPPPPNITTTSIPIGTVNVPYLPTTLTATGGVPPLTWQPVGLPFGLTFTASTATISGTPTSSGSQNVTFTVNDDTAPINQTDSQVLNLTVNAALTIDTTTPLPAGTVGQPYAPVQLVASGGAPPYTWSITGTGQPNQAAPGLSLSSGGVIGGGGQTPTTADSFTRTYRVQDNNGVDVSKSLTLNVNAALTIGTPTPLPAGKVGDAYSTPLLASGGTGPGTYTWTLASDSPDPLPDGLTLTPDGVLSGTPGLLSAGLGTRTYSLKFTVEDQTSPTPQSVSTTVSLTITLL